MATAKKIEGVAKGKSVKSSDPRKPGIVEALKAASGAGKVTSVVECKDGSFAGHCMVRDDKPRGRGGYDSVGWWSVEPSA